MGYPLFCMTTAVHFKLAVCRKKCWSCVRGVAFLRHLLCYALTSGQKGGMLVAREEIAFDTEGTVLPEVLRAVSSFAL